MERTTPVILTTSQLLTTGVDAPTCRNIVLVRVINSMVEFKQIIGRGTRVRDDYGKLFFNILDYTGAATRLFADPDFDGEPAALIEEKIDDRGKITEPVVRPIEASEALPGTEPVPQPPEAPEHRRKFYYDGGQVEIATHLVYELDPDGQQLRVIKFTDYTAERVRTFYRSTAELRAAWTDPAARSELISRLAERGIDFEELADAAGQPDADPFDLLCHVAFNAPLRTRRERATRLRAEKKAFFERFGTEARSILDELLQKYADHGAAQFTLPEVLEVPPINRYGNVIEIAHLFGGEQQLRDAIESLQNLLYAA